MSGHIIRIKSNDVIAKLLNAEGDLEISTPLEDFDNDEDAEFNLKKYEIYIENNFENSKDKGIIKDTAKAKTNTNQKENPQHGKSNSPELERH